MPKEIVYDPLSPFGEEADAVTVVEVHWSRDAGHVQLVSRCISRTTHEPYAPPDGPTTPAGDPDLSYLAGYWANLDRRGINDLIRHLRRARDQSFGRDE